MAEFNDKSPEKQSSSSLFSQFIDRHPELNFNAAPADANKSVAKTVISPEQKDVPPSSYPLPKIDITDNRSSRPEYNNAPERRALSSTEKPVSRNSEDWHKQHDALVRKAENSNPSVAFFGDSITKGMESGNALKKAFGEKADNFGIVGDSTQHLLWRLQHGEANFKQKPEEAVLLIGANNVGNASARDIARGIIANVDEMQKQMPDAKLLVLGVLPQGKSASDPRREKIREINDELQKQLSGKANVTYFDAGARMLEKDGSMSSKVWWGDGLHPRDYSPMFAAIKPVLDKMKSGR